MEPTLDQVRHELTEIHEELLTLPSDDFSRRADLKERQNELRQLSHRLIEEQQVHDPQTLRVEFERLHALRDELLEKHISEGAATSIGDAGIDSHFTSAINKAIDSGLGIDDVEARMKQILEELRSSS